MHMTELQRVAHWKFSSIIKKHVTGVQPNFTHKKLQRLKNVHLEKWTWETVVREISIEEYNERTKTIRYTFVSNIIEITLSSNWALYSLTRSMVFWCDAWSPCDIFKRATFIPSSASFHIISRVLEEGSIVQTTFVFRQALTANFDRFTW